MPPGGAAAHAAKLAFQSLGGKGAAVKATGTVMKGAGMVLKGAGLVATGAAVTAGIDQGVEGIVGSTSSSSRNEQEDKFGSNGRSWGISLGLPSVSSIASSSQGNVSRQNLVAGFFAANGVSTSTYPVAAAGKAPIAEVSDTIAVTETPKKKVTGFVDAYLAKVAVYPDASGTKHTQTSTTEPTQQPSSSRNRENTGRRDPSKQGVVPVQDKKQAPAAKEQEPLVRLPVPTSVADNVFKQPAEGASKKSVANIGDAEPPKDQQKPSSTHSSTLSAQPMVPVPAPPAPAVAVAESPAAATPVVAKPPAAAAVSSVAAPAAAPVAPLPSSSSSATLPASRPSAKDAAEVSAITSTTSIAPHAGKP